MPCLHSCIPWKALWNVNKHFVLEEVGITFRGILYFFKWVRAFRNSGERGGGVLKYDESYIINKSYIKENTHAASMGDP